MMPSIEKIVIVVGCQRSGTTLVGQILGAHPNSILIDETDGVYDWFRSFVENKSQVNESFSKIIKTADSKYLPGYKRTRGKPAVLDEQITHIVLKAPNLTFEYHLVAKLRIPVSVIYPVRDVRPVVRSMKNLFQTPIVERQLAYLKSNSALAREFQYEVDLLEADSVDIAIKRALVWKIKSNLQEKFIQRNLPVFSFQYEKLVADTGVTCAQIAKHVGLAFDNQMTRHEAVYAGVGPGGTQRSRSVDKASIAKWQEDLSLADQKAILAFTTPSMEALGYKIGIEGQITSATIVGPIILTGRGGSGTRLLSDIVSESGVFLGNKFNDSSDSMEWADLIYDMVADKLAIRRKPSVDKINWNARSQANAVEILSRGKYNMGQPWGWKLPETIIVLPEFFEAFPATKLIHLVRHPVGSSLRATHLTSRIFRTSGISIMKAVLRSLIRIELRNIFSWIFSPVGIFVLTAAYKKNGRNVLRILTDRKYMRNAITWDFQVAQAIEYCHVTIPPDRYLEVRFEDLCAEPELTISRIQAFIGAEHQPIDGPDIDCNRIPKLDQSDPRIDRIWNICQVTAKKIGYNDPV